MLICFDSKMLLKMQKQNNNLEGSFLTPKHHNLPTNFKSQANNFN
jgi:hypothetical protein